MGEDYYPKDNIDAIKLDLNEVSDRECIIVDKVYASCQQRECFPMIEEDIDDKTFKELRFEPGFIVPNTLVVTDIENRPQFRRVRFTLRIPYKIIYTDNTFDKKFLPDIQKDVILFIPDARDEFEFKIVVETSSRELGTPAVVGEKITFAVGVFIIIKVVGTVQLLIPAFGFCPEPPECEEFSPEGICDNFDYAPFPDFFPPQFEDIFED